MQNTETPNDLVRQELSARLQTIAKDRSRLSRQRRAAYDALSAAQAEEQDNEERCRQFLAARLALEPEESFTDSLGYRILLHGAKNGVPAGTVVRILYWNSERAGAEWFVTTDPSLPVLQRDLDYQPLTPEDAWDLIEAFSALDKAFWTTGHDSDEYTKK